MAESRVVTFSVKKELIPDYDKAVKGIEDRQMNKSGVICQLLKDFMDNGFKFNNKVDVRLKNLSTRMFCALIEVLPDLKGNLEAIGSCDHEVGICCCGLIDNIHTVEEILKDATEA